jgi:hypothetical protein
VATAVAEYLARRPDLGVAEHNAAEKVQGRVDHRLGEVLRETVNHKGGRPRINPDGVSGFIPPEIGSSDASRWQQSSRAQQLALIPWHKIALAIDLATREKKRASPRADRVGPELFTPE